MVEFQKLRNAVSRYYVENSVMPYSVIVGRDYYQYLVKAIGNYGMSNELAILSPEGYIMYSKLKVRPSANVPDSDVILVDTGGFVR